MYNELCFVLIGKFLVVQLGQRLTITLCPTWSTILWPGRKLTNSFCRFGQPDIDHVGNHFHLMSFLVNRHLTSWDYEYFRKATCLTGQQVYWPSRPTFWITWFYGLIGVFVVHLKGRQNLHFSTCPFLSTVGVCIAVYSVFKSQNPRINFQTFRYCIEETSINLTKCLLLI